MSDKLRSKTSHPSERYDDPDPETGEKGEVTEKMMSDGIADRIMNAGIGDALLFREGIEQTTYIPLMTPSMRNRVWGEVLNILCEAGVVEKKVADGAYVKKTIAFGMDRGYRVPDLRPDGPDLVPLAELIQQILWERGNRFDLFDEAGLHEFIKMSVSEEGDDFFAERKIPRTAIEDICKVFVEELLKYLPAVREEKARTGFTSDERHDAMFEACMSKIQEILGGYDNVFDNIGRLVCEVLVRVWGHRCWKDPKSSHRQDN